MARRAFDRYCSADWQTRALLAHVDISGSILEPCNGNGDISRVLVAEGYGPVTTNDIDTHLQADWYEDATRLVCPSKDWWITNPPYTMPDCLNIAKHALKQARVGVALLLRISFREPTAHKHPRGPFLEAYPPSQILTLPRYSFTQDGKSDMATTEWVIWVKDNRRIEHPIRSLYQANLIY